MLNFSITSYLVLSICNYYVRRISNQWTKHQEDSKSNRLILKSSKKRTKFSLFLKFSWAWPLHIFQFVGQVAEWFDKFCYLITDANQIFLTALVQFHRNFGNYQAILQNFHHNKNHPEQLQDLFQEPHELSNVDHDQVKESSPKNIFLLQTCFCFTLV